MPEAVAPVDHAAQAAQLREALAILIHSLDFRSKRDRDAARREAQAVLDATRPERRS